MSRLLVIKSSILSAHSTTGLLIDEVVASLSKQDPSQQVVTRDLAASPLPQLDGDVLAGFSASEGLSASQQAARNLSETLIAEVAAADRLVIGVPMYNFGLPTQLKSWLDYLCRAGVTFSYTEQGPVGLLADKPVLLVVATGGLHRGTQTDLAVAHIRTVLNFVGLKNLTLAYAEGLGMGPDARDAGLAQARQALLPFVA